MFCRMFTRVPLLVLLVLVIGAIVLLVVLLVPSGNNELDEAPLVETRLGSIRGLRASDGDYDMFLGIPYAKVNPTNHFGASTPYPRFDDIFLANDDSARCPQMYKDQPVGGIDCLQLNIFVPHSASNTNRLPVMVWIDGYAFETSWKTAAWYGPKYLIEHEVILITLNYRVGPYGFMCLDIPEAPGNQGLKDQVLAMRWVRDNIEAFGGDINKITAFGMSAGGQSIDFHILSDSEPLFQNAIMQSGSAVASNVFTQHLKEAPITIAKHLGFNTSSINDALSHLSSISSNLVIQAWKELELVFKPCTEIKFDNVEAFLTRPWVSANKPKAKNMSILTGYNKHEQLLQYVSPDAFDDFNVVHDKLQKSFDFDEAHLFAMERHIKNFYFGDKVINSDLLWPVVEFDSDFTYIHPVHRSIRKYLESEVERVFLYEFSYNGGRNVAKFVANVTIGSAVHGDEAGYLFDMELFPEQPTSEDQFILDRFTTMWTNFAKYSDPTPQLSTTLLPVTWIPITDSSYNYLSIDSNMEVGRGPAFQRMTFLDLFYKYNKENQKGYRTQQ